MWINNYDLPFDKVICHLLALWLGEGGVRHLIHKASHSQGINMKAYKKSPYGTEKGQEGKIDFMFSDITVFSKHQDWDTALNSVLDSDSAGSGNSEGFVFGLNIPG